MGKASSTKKVARAASSGGGGRVRRTQARPWTYYSVLAVMVILGVFLTWTSRDRHLAQVTHAGTVQQPTVGTVWNEGYAIYLCGTFAPAFTHAKNPEGITTGDGDGIIHIHPTVKSAAGKNATLGKFASAVGMTLNAAEIQLPGGKQYLDGDSCEGHAGDLYVKQFDYIGDKVGLLYNGAKGQLGKLDPSEVPLADQALVTIAFVPSSDASSIPPPPEYVNKNLQKLEPSTSTTTTLPKSTSTTTTKSTTATTTKSTTATTAAK
jgi:hypothetical protein